MASTLHQHDAIKYIIHTPFNCTLRLLLECRNLWLRVNGVVTYNTKCSIRIGESKQVDNINRINIFASMTKYRI